MCVCVCVLYERYFLLKLPFGIIVSPFNYHIIEVCLIGYRLSSRRSHVLEGRMVRVRRHLLVLTILSLYWQPAVWNALLVGVELSEKGMRQGTFH